MHRGTPTKIWAPELSSLSWSAKGFKQFPKVQETPARGGSHAACLTCTASLTARAFRSIPAQTTRGDAVFRCFSDVLQGYCEPTREEDVSTLGRAMSQVAGGQVWLVELEKQCATYLTAVSRRAAGCFQLAVREDSQISFEPPQCHLRPDYWSFPSLIALPVHYCRVLSSVIELNVHMCVFCTALSIAYISTRSVAVIDFLSSACDLTAKRTMAQDSTWQDLLRQAACLSPKTLADVDRSSPILDATKEYTAVQVDERLDWQSGAVSDSFQQQLEAYLDQRPLLRACQPSLNCSPSGSHAVVNLDCSTPHSRIHSDAAAGMPCSACPSAVPSRQLSLADAPASSPPPMGDDNRALEALLEVLSSPNQGATLAALLQLVAQLVKDPQTAQLLAEATGAVDAEQQCSPVVPAQPAMSDCPCSSVGSNNDVEDDEPSTADSAPPMDDQLNLVLSMAVEKQRMRRTADAANLEGARKKLRFH